MLKYEWSVESQNKYMAIFESSFYSGVFFCSAALRNTEIDPFAKIKILSKN